MGDDIINLTKLFGKLQIDPQKQELSKEIDVVQNMFKQLKLDSSNDEINDLIDNIESLHITDPIDSNDNNVVTIKFKNNIVIQYCVLGCNDFQNDFSPQWGEAF